MSPALRVRIPESSAAVDDVADFAAVASTVHASLDPLAVALAIAQAGQTWIGCDRVSVLVRDGRRWRTLAVSGQPRVSASSPAVRRLEALVSSVAQRNALWCFDRTAPDCSPGLQTDLAAYLAVAPVRQVRIHVLSDSAGSDPTSARRSRPFAAVVTESFGEHSDSVADSQRIEWLMPVAKLALLHAVTTDQILLRSTLVAAGRWWRAVDRNGLLKWLVATVLLIGGIFGMTCCPATQHVSASGRLLPSQHCSLFAPTDGEVVELLVEGGQRVDAGQPLLRLSNSDLAEQLILTRNRITELEQGLTGLKAELHEVGRTATDRAELVRLQTRVTQSQIELQGLRRQLDLLEEQESQLVVVAPQAGLVTSNDLANRLSQRPVRRGERLLELADDRGPWHLELELPERRFGRLRTNGSELSIPFTVKYRLTARPDAAFDAVVESIGARTTLKSGQGAVVLIRAAIDPQQRPPAWIGADVEARIQGSETTLADVLFGDVIDFCHRNLWW